jgi:pimeloyl-ACP methyl ester carboxylesterase
MEFLDDLRDPRTLVGKIFITLLLLLLLSSLALLAISGLVLRTVLWPEKSSMGVDPESLINQPEVFTFTAPGGKTYEGWLFPGLRTAPVIILCHGYRSQRSDLLTMVSPLQEHQYNVVVFDFRGHGANEGSTTLGPGEARTLLALIEELSRRNDLDGTRFGLWGADLGGYAAFSAAATEPRVKAMAVDSLYDQPTQFLDLQVEAAGATAVPLAPTVVRLGYWLLNWSTRNEPPLSARVGTLSQTAKLFIQGRQSPALAEQTLQLFLQSPEPRAQVVLPRTGYTSLPKEEKQEYDNQVLNFFMTNLPTTPPPPAAGR